MLEKLDKKFERLQHELKEDWEAYRKSPFREMERRRNNVSFVIDLILTLLGK